MHRKRAVKQLIAQSHREDGGGGGGGGGGAGGGGGGGAGSCCWLLVSSVVEGTGVGGVGFAFGVVAAAVICCGCC